jgi:hypothetical protein
MWVEGDIRDLRERRNSLIEAQENAEAAERTEVAKRSAIQRRKPNSQALEDARKDRAANFTPPPRT